MHLVEMSAAVLGRALLPFAAPVRVLDALHLATMVFLRGVRARCGCCAVACALGSRWGEPATVSSRAPCLNRRDCRLPMRALRYGASCG